MSENQAEYKIDTDTHTIPAIEVHPPQTHLVSDGKGFESYREDVWIKLSVTFRKYMRNLKGSRLAVFLAICLHIDEKGTCYPSIETLSEETGYSPREVMNATKELESAGLLTANRHGMRSNLYHVEAFASIGAESSHVQKAASIGAVLSKNMSQNALKEEPIKEDSKKTGFQEKKGDLVDLALKELLPTMTIRTAVEKYFPFNVNWETKTSRQWLEWARNENVTADQLRSAADRWRSDKKFNWQQPNLQLIFQNWPALNEKTFETTDTYTTL